MNASSGEPSNCCVWTMKTRAGSRRAQWFYRWAGALTALLVFFPLYLTLSISLHFTYTFRLVIDLQNVHSWEKRKRPSIQVIWCPRRLIQALLLHIWHRQVRQVSLLKSASVKLWTNLFIVNANTIGSAETPTMDTNTTSTSSGSLARTPSSSRLLSVRSKHSISKHNSKRRSKSKKGNSLIVSHVTKD